MSSTLVPLPTTSMTPRSRLNNPPPPPHTSLYLTSFVGCLFSQILLIICLFFLTLWTILKGVICAGDKVKWEAQSFVVTSDCGWLRCCQMGSQDFWIPSMCGDKTERKKKPFTLHAERIFSDGAFHLRTMQGSAFEFETKRTFGIRELAHSCECWTLKCAVWEAKKEENCSNCLVELHQWPTQLKWCYSSSSHLFIRPHKRLWMHHK